MKGRKGKWVREGGGKSRRGREGERNGGEEGRKREPASVKADHEPPMETRSLSFLYNPSETIIKNKKKKNKNKNKNNNNNNKMCL